MFVVLVAHGDKKMSSYRMRTELLDTDRDRVTRYRPAAQCIVKTEKDETRKLIIVMGRRGGCLCLGTMFGICLLLAQLSTTLKAPRTKHQASSTKHAASATALDY